MREETKVTKGQFHSLMEKADLLMREKDGLIPQPWFPAKCSLKRCVVQGTATGLFPNEPSDDALVTLNFGREQSSKNTG